MLNSYLLTFYLKYFPGSVFTNTSCFALSDLFAYAITGSILKATNTNTTFLSA